MKKLAIVVLASLFFVGCENSTTYGECIGFDDEEVKELKYEISIRNAVISAIFIESIVVPVIWALDDAKCPIGEK